MAQLPGQPGLTPSNCSPFPENTGAGAGAGGVGWGLLLSSLSPNFLKGQQDLSHAGPEGGLSPGQPGVGAWDPDL